MLKILTEIMTLICVLVLPLFGPPKKKKKKVHETNFYKGVRFTELMRRGRWSY